MLIAILVLFLELLITWTIYVYIVNVLSFLEYQMSDSESEFSFRKEGSEENSQTEESKFPQSKITKKRNFEDKLLISMDKARKARSIQLASK